MVAPSTNFGLTHLVVGAVLDAEVDVVEALGFWHPALGLDLPRVAQVDHGADAEPQEPLPVGALELAERVGAVEGLPRHGATVGSAVAAQVAEVVQTLELDMPLHRLSPSCLGIVRDRPPVPGCSVRCSR